MASTSQRVAHLRSFGVKDLPEDLQDRMGHLLPTFNFMAKAITLEKAVAFEIISQAKVITKVHSFLQKVKKKTIT